MALSLQRANSEIRKILGKNASIQVRGAESSPELREEARKERQVAETEKNAALAALKARREAILSADPEYQALRRQFEAATEKENQAPNPWHYQFCAGVANSLFFTVKAEGDSADEVLEKVRNGN